MSEQERRQTPTERNHELLKLALERPAPVSGLPAFDVAQEKAVGGATVFTWSVHVPVGDEFTTAEAAFEAAAGFAARLTKLFPAPNPDDKLREQLEQSAKGQAQRGAIAARAAMKGKSGPTGVVK